MNLFLGHLSKTDLSCNESIVGGNWRLRNGTMDGFGEERRGKQVAVEWENAGPGPVILLATLKLETI
jgi:hypothetical protein